MAIYCDTAANVVKRIEGPGSSGTTWGVATTDRLQLGVISEEIFKCIGGYTMIDYYLAFYLRGTKGEEIPGLTFLRDELYLKLSLSHLTALFIVFAEDV
jgi:hypothetical protein